VRFGERLAELCAARGLTLNALAVRCGVRRQSLYALRAERCQPSLDTARRVAVALGVTLDALCEGLEWE
jgi:transcriptional regulator with XRE-family HTH domain